MSVAYALLAALAYGISDFFGGLLARKISVWQVALTACTGATVAGVLLAVTHDGRATGADLAWGTLAGIGSGFGTIFLYRGLSRGRMGVVAPVSSVGSAIVPIAVGVFTGDRPSALVWIGVLVALPGIWLVARTSSSVGDNRPSGLTDGLLAGAAFGLLFSAQGQVPASHGYWPLALNEFVSVLVIAIVGTLARQKWVPRSPLAFTGLIIGLGAGAAMYGFVLATSSGLLSVSAVLTALYPAATVMLAALVLRERIHRPQLVGLAFCAAAVVCIALG